METMSPNELLKLWKLEEITVEMSIGHILQNDHSQHAKSL